MFIDDRILENAAKPVCLKIWVPDEPIVVIGAANEETREVFTQHCRTLNIPVMKRAGGGGAVVLYPGCVIVSLGLWVKKQFNNGLYFQLLNAAVIQSLVDLNPKFAELGQRGFSDITYGDRKIAGTSLFRSKHYLLYQASLLVDLDLDLLNRCLPHPSKEPDYRGGKSHADFLVGLADIVGGLTVLDVLNGFKNTLESTLYKTLVGELSSPEPLHVPHLLKRSQASSLNNR